MTDDRNVPAFHVRIRGRIAREMDLQYSDFTDGKLGVHIDVTPIVPTFAGKATSVSSLLEIIQPKEEATHVIFHASDEFQAILPLGDLKDALLLFQQENGEPLKKGFPVRLLVPNGSSDCLNVKSVVQIEFVKNTDEPQQEATFGFKNIVSATEL